jgi:lipoyl(octanoyl) transferase
MDMNNISKLRVMLDGARGGAENMAVDEAVLLAVGEKQAPATLRFYRWSKPTISLGYFQRYEEFYEQEEEISRLPVVRRQTGGGAILHDDEITYSLVLPIHDKDQSTDIADLYRLVHDAFIAALGTWGVTADYRGGQELGNSQRGPFFCFAREHRLDLLLGGQKLLGSAQRRMKHAVLQHGSLILGRHFQQQPSAELRPAIGSPFDLEEILAGVTERISKQLGLPLEPGELSDWEREKVTELLEKYGGEAWTRQR